MGNAENLFKCLSDETRLSIVLLVLSEGELCVCELMAALDCSQPKISRHLQRLRNCELLQDERRGQWVYYSIHSGVAVWALKVLHNVAEAHQPQIHQFRKKITGCSSEVS